MIKFNDGDESIEISEFLSFKGTVQNEYDTILEDLKFNLENESELSSEEVENTRKFVNYVLSHEDKMKILEYIVDEYYSSSNYFENQSIFDEDLIQKGIKDWINDNFDLNL